MNAEQIAVPKKGVTHNAPQEKSLKELKPKHFLKNRSRSDYLTSKFNLVSIVTGAKSANRRADVLQKVKEGLDASSIRQLEEALHATQAEMAKFLTIPISTLRRRIRNSEKLAVDESDRVVRLARLRDLAVAMMGGDEEAATRWLHTPRDILNNETPLEHASTEIGAREVEELIGRIRHGVFS